MRRHDYNIYNVLEDRLASEAVHKAIKSPPTDKNMPPLTPESIVSRAKGWKIWTDIKIKLATQFIIYG